MTPLLRRLECLIGPTGSGKTTMAKDLEKHGLHVLLIGAECRKKFGEAAMATADNVCTPGISEEFVRHLITTMLDSDAKDMVVDGFPRSQEQAKWLVLECAKRGVQLTAVWIHAAAGIRMARLARRDGGSDNTKSALHFRRLTEESQQLEQTLAELAKHGVYWDNYRNE